MKESWELPSKHKTPGKVKARVKARTDEFSQQNYHEPLLDPGSLLLALRAKGRIAKGTSSLHLCPAHQKG